MKREIYENYVKLLKTELIPALGCTEPIALAYAGAKMREVLLNIPEKVIVYASANIIKNVKGVKVPNSGGLKGVEAAVLLGVVGGNPNKELEVLQDINDFHRLEAKKLLDGNICQCDLKENVPNLYIEVIGIFKDDCAKVLIENTHTNITKIEKNGKVLFLKEEEKEENKKIDKTFLNIKDIVEFANEVDITDVEDVLNRQIECNYRISQEGLEGNYGARIGKIAFKENKDSKSAKIIARTAAGSDARMGGCPMPVVINSGSGNQGMTCSIPVIEFSKNNNISKEDLFRALCVSNLVSMNQKQYIGSLSAFCGVICAAAGAMAGITYLKTKDIKKIEGTVSNTLAMISGMVCDGAKASCAGKIYTALESAYLAHNMAMNDVYYEQGDGLIMEDVEKTIKAVGHVGKYGMKETDIEILNIMIGKTRI